VEVPLPADQAIVLEEAPLAVSQLWVEPLPSPTEERMKTWSTMSALDKCSVSSPFLSSLSGLRRTSNRKKAINPKTLLEKNLRRKRVAKRLAKMLPRKKRSPRSQTRPCRVASA